mmetsp:Transcript_34620/g.76940  ORF Transcript_34620/g.76940 Transcript_34620/m.76940 type:complete len:174 (-) Transcript_34620:429-950(-)
MHAVELQTLRTEHTQEAPPWISNCTAQITIHVSTCSASMHTVEAMPLAAMPRRCWPPSAYVHICASKTLYTSTWCNLTYISPGAQCVCRYANELHTTCDSLQHPNPSHLNTLPCGFCWPALLLLLSVSFGPDHTVCHIQLEGLEVAHHVITVMAVIQNASPLTDDDSRHKVHE